MKDKHLFNLPIGVRFQKCFTAKAQHMIMLGQSQVTKTHTAVFQQKIGVTKKSLTFDDLHQMTLIGHHVTQYMYVLFDNVHIYIQESQFTLVYYVQ